MVLFYEICIDLFHVGFYIFFCFVQKMNNLRFSDVKKVLESGWPWPLSLTARIMTVYGV